jgi:hypothetical protein
MIPFPDDGSTENFWNIGYLLQMGSTGSLKRPFLSIKLLKISS